MVIHHQVRLIQGAGVAKRENLTVQFPAVYDAAETKQALGDQDWDTSDVVGNHLMEVQDIDRVGKRFLVRGIPQYQITVFQPRQCVRLPICGAVYRYDGIPKIGLQFIGYLTQRHESCIGRAKSVEKYVFQRHVMDAAVKHWNGPSNGRRLFRSYRSRLRCFTGGLLSGSPWHLRLVRTATRRCQHHHASRHSEPPSYLLQVQPKPLTCFESLTVCSMPPGRLWFRRLLHFGNRGFPIAHQPMADAIMRH